MYLHIRCIGASPSSCIGFELYIDLWNLLSYQCATTEPYTKQSGQDKKIDHEKNQCGHHMETSRKTVY